MSVKAVVFDLDGTLTDSVADIATALNTIRQKEGFPLLLLSEVLSAVGDGARKLVERTVPTGVNIDRFLGEFMLAYQQCLSEQTVPYAGIPQLLGNLNVPLAVVSNKPHQLTCELLHQLNLDHHFDYILGADGGAKKPNPEPIFRAMVALGTTADKTLMVGDHQTDLYAGNSAGCKTCFCTYGYGSTGDAVFDFSVSSVEELTTLLLRVTR